LRRGGLAALDSPEAYLRRAIVNLSSNHRRTFGRRRRAIARWSGDLVAGADDRYASDIAELAALEPLSRAALYLRIVERFSYDEISALLDTSPASMRMTVSRALAQLRSTLDTDDERRP
jgi:DNA-directed RNA polymerase specialized sigma24 family protein